jgi:hypothetical protein
VLSSAVCDAGTLLPRSNVSNDSGGSGLVAYAMTATLLSTIASRSEARMAGNSIIFDAHHRLWKVDRGDCPWMTRDVPCLARDYLADDLRPHCVRSE